MIDLPTERNWTTGLNCAGRRMGSDRRVGLAADTKVRAGERRSPRVLGSATRDMTPRSVAVRAVRES